MRLGLGLLTVEVMADANYPRRPVRIAVPSSSGAGTDNFKIPTNRVVEVGTQVTI